MNPDSEYLKLMEARTHYFFEGITANTMTQPSMNTDEFSKFEQGDRTAYTMIASMRESEFLKAIQDSENLMGLFKVGRMEGKRLWVYNGDIDWDYYLESGEYRVKLDDNNLRSSVQQPIVTESKFVFQGSEVEPLNPEKSTAEIRNQFYEDFKRRHPRKK